MKTPHESPKLSALSKALGIELKKIRLLREESQIDVATAVNKSRTYLSEFENGAHNPSLSFLIEISSYYNILLSEIIQRAEQHLS